MIINLIIMIPFKGDIATTDVLVLNIYPLFFSFSQVEVTVLDENDSPPVFTESLYTASVAESVNPGHVVTTVEARDPDTVGTVLYSIEGGDFGKFSVDPSTGE